MIDMKKTNGMRGRKPKSDPNSKVNIVGFIRTSKTGRSITIFEGQFGDPDTRMIGFVKISALKNMLFYQRGFTPVLGIPEQEKSEHEGKVGHGGRRKKQ